MKKNISITLAVLLALSAFCAGCSSQSGSTGGTQAAETEAVETQTAEAAEASGTEAAVQETEAAGAETSPDASGSLPDQEANDTWSLISGYGFYDGTCDDKDISYSNLSFTLKTDTLEDLGDTWSVEAEIYKNVQIPADLAEGEEITVTLDELKGTTVTIVRKGEELVNVDDGNDTYYCGEADGSGECLLMQLSDDVVCDHFSDGKLIVRKNATYGIAIMHEYQTVDENCLGTDPWFNGVAFNENGEVTALVFFGD